MMTQSKILYYNSLPEGNQKVLQLAALKSDFTYSDIHTLAYVYLKKQVGQQYIVGIIEDALKHNLFHQLPDRYHRYCVDVEFLVYIFPKIEITALIWQRVVAKDYYYTTNLISFRNCLHSLLHAPDSYSENENKIYRTPGKVTDYFTILLQDEQYEQYFPLISKKVLSYCIQNIISNAKITLKSWDEVLSITQRFTLAAHCPSLGKVPVALNTYYWHVQLDKALELAEDNISKIEFNAIKSLIEGNLKESLAYFDLTLKAQSSQGNKVYLPARTQQAYFYLVALLLSDKALSMPIFTKMLSWWARRGENHYSYTHFGAVIYDVTAFLSDPLNKIKNTIKQNISSQIIDYHSLLDILVSYLIGEKLAEEETCYQIVKKAADGGYWLLAYEAAFVINQWFSDKKIEQLYQNLSDQLNYTPVISRIVRQEEWERSLNLLLDLKSKSASKDASKIEAATRVVYYFNPNYFNEITPVLQTKKASTNRWSKGRNIAMKTFALMAVKGMTEQDMRIAKCINVQQDRYCAETYFFTQQAYVEMIGHPYIFLHNSDDIPIELIEGQVIISIKQVETGYQLSSNLKKIDTFSIEKETNTRYKIYQLSSTQVNILRIINQNIQDGGFVIPIKGKEKLSELMSVLTGEGFTIHSDLLAANENSDVEIKETDSRIRVQLLPFGDGLKAELFSKPFGDRPPYCKPGKGGVILISNEENVQWQVHRDLLKESEYEQILLNDIQSLDSLNNGDDLLCFDDPLDSLYLLDILQNHADICVVEWAEGERYKLKGSANVNQLSINIKSGIDWFDLQGEITIDENTVISLQQLLKLTENSHKKFIELSCGEFIALSDRLKRQLDSLRMFATTDKQKVHLNKFAFAGLEDFFAEIENIKADEQWTAFCQNVEQSKSEVITLPNNLHAELRAYQEDGFRWMVRLSQWGAGACLADDMGLGKTLQTLAVLLHRSHLGAALVVCPVSVISNWVSEAKKFAPSLNIKTLGTSATDRKAIFQSLGKRDVLVTSYGLVQSESQLFTETTFATAVLDEAHVTKNYATKTSKAIMQIKADFKIALTGTPLQNHLGEIWNLFNFINPGLLGTLQHFAATFIKSEDEKSKKHLKNLIAPFILRRTKSSVLDELPPKTEIIKKISLSPEEIAFYESIRRQALDNIADVDTGKNIQVLAEILRLRQACCNPQLIDKKIRIPSSKMATFLEIVNELIENKHRALVFSQFVSHLSLVRDELDKKHIDYQYIDGATSQSQREESVQQFQSGNGNLFLISLKAGGLGLNLTAADYVIHLDPWWNPAVEDQASDRAHRIGQQRPVTIYRLVAENTIEEKIIQLHSRKRDLAEQLLEGSDLAARLSVKEMLNLIKERENES
ncbi:MAG: DEAD/DEAH box helicase [Bacteroidales bacterium]|jgi:SNF2 family DNA or RNA helicase|nr:DEAD/DEAH box helicase [Bacteroidales bacterium]